MEEQLSSLTVTHLLQYTLRSLCIHDNSQWVYAVFWRILPRNYPPPKWDSQGAYDRSRGNRRNWILVWEDGFCNFAASTSEMMINNGVDHHCCGGSSSTVYGINCEYQNFQGLQPELFFKMSHEIYNYGEGLIGKVAADHSHKWIYKEPNDQEINFLSAWHNSDSQPRTWEAQFQSGVKTIALIAVREGVIQLGSIHKVIEDLSYVVLLRKKFSYIESIPGVLLPHPSSTTYPFKVDGYGGPEAAAWHYQGSTLIESPMEYYYHHHHQNDHHQYNDQQLPMKITPSMSSLEALLSKLPSVVPPSPSPPPPAMPTYNEDQPQQQQQQQQQQHYQLSLNRPAAEMAAAAATMEKVSKQEYDNDVDDDDDDDQDHNDYKQDKDNVGDQSSSSMSMSMSSYRHHSVHYGYDHHHRM